MDILSLAREGALAVLNFLNGIPPEYYAVIVASIPVSGILVIIKTGLKRKWDTTPSETKMFLTNFFTLVTMAVGAYLTTTPTADPINAIFSMVGLSLVVQQPVYFRFIKPILKQAFENYDAGKALNEELRSAAINGATPIE